MNEEKQSKEPKKKFSWKRVLIVTILVIIGGWLCIYISFYLKPIFLGGFCGSSEGTCSSESDCFTTGCSGEVCASEGIMTTCEWRDCYNDEAYGVYCTCSRGECKWIKE